MGIRMDYTDILENMVGTNAFDRMHIFVKAFM